VSTPLTLPATAAAITPGRGAFHVLRGLVRDKRAVFSIVVLVAFAVLGLLAPWLAPHSPTQQHLDSVLKGSSATYWLGTDDVGRDVLSRLMYASGVSLTAATLAVGVGLLIGYPLGLVSGYIGGWFDEVMMRLVDALLAFPHLVLALAITGVLGPNLTHAMFAVGVVFSPIIARLIRGQVLAIKSEIYLDEARLLGAPAWWIVVRHIVPNTLSPIIIQTALLLGLALIAEASLSFLGLGVQPPEASWGSMLGRSYRYIMQQPLMILPPAIAIATAVLAFNLLGDALRDMLEIDRR
jgi:peptide/nickel transport system permease protein